VTARPSRAGKKRAHRIVCDAGGWIHKRTAGCESQPEHRLRVRYDGPLIHSKTEKCWCEPRIEDYTSEGGTKLIIHRVPS